MAKKIFIDASDKVETRIALLEDSKLEDYEIEKLKDSATKGDVYLAKITRVEPSLQAAFVDYGGNKNGFLPLTEIHPDYFKIPISDQETFKKLSIEVKKNENEEENDSNENQKNNDDNDRDENNYFEVKRKYLNFFRKYKIQEVIKTKQVILVQINKEERGVKGAALTTFLSFPGKFCVLMPNSQNKNGISRKINDLDERKNLKNIIESIKIPENMALIIRTAGIGKTKKEISKDLEFLVSQWNKIRQQTLKSKAPCLIYKDGNLIKRTIRDLLTNDVKELIIDGKDGHKIAKEYAKEILPAQIKKIKLFKRKQKSLFTENNIENQINDLFSLKVNLKSGGSIVINTTEALVAIDVNSGKNTFQRNIESTALNTNIEAAVEIARQLRLRDLGGLVVIDFIDMEDYRNNYKVEKTLKTALYKDRARIQTGRISMFGLLELSRQRVRSSLIEKSFQKCHLCNGSGVILNPTSISDQIMKVVSEKLTNNPKSIIEVKCNTSLAELLLNSKREEVIELEKNFDSKIEFNLSHLYSLHEPEISLIETKNLDSKNNGKDESKQVSIVNKKKTEKLSKQRKKIKYKKEDKKLVEKSKEQPKAVINKEKKIKTGWWAE